MRPVMIWIITCLFLIAYYYQISAPPQTEGYGLIVQKEAGNYYNRYRIFHQFRMYQWETNQSFSSGQIIQFKGTSHPYPHATIPHGFDPYYYYLGQNIVGKLEVSEIKEIYQIPIIDFKDQDDALIKLFKDLNFFEIDEISFIFSLSSIHLSIIYLIVFKVLRFFDFKNHQKYIILTWLSLCFYWIGFSVLILRWLLKFLFQYLSVRYDLKWTALDIESLGFIVILCVFPLSMYHYGFIILYLFVFFNHLKVAKHPLLQCLLAPLIMIPFLSIFQRKVNVTLLLLLPFITLIAKYLFVPSILLFTLIPHINVIPFIGSLFNTSIQLLKPYMVKIYFLRLEGIILVLYFIFIIYILYSSHMKQLMKRVLMWIFLVVILGLSTFKTPVDQVIFLDVGQGDSAVIFKNGYTIVVDAYQYVRNYLESVYIRKIDFLVLSHSDLDHMKEAEALINHFDVGKIFLSGYQTYALLHDDIVYVDRQYLPKIEAIDMNFLGPLKDYQNTNDNSLVFQITVKGVKYLFTGDISVMAEQDLVKTYQNSLKSDVLKVPHHGSNTSSESSFIEMVLPKIAVISVSKHNPYQLPNDEVIHRYQRFGIQVMITKNHGSILIKDNDIYTFPP